MKTNTNRKLKRNVVFDTLEAYIGYQIQLVKRHSEKLICKEDEFLEWLEVVHGCNHAESTNMYKDELNRIIEQDFQMYVKSGLAKKFEQHHRPHEGENEIVVSELGQKIN